MGCKCHQTASILELGVASQKEQESDAEKEQEKDAEKKPESEQETATTELS